MRTYRLTLEYDGSKYSGWQDQTNARTVQGELKQAVATVFKCEAEVQGAGRTDAGVHAVGQVAHVKLAANATTREAAGLSAARVLRELNDALPSSIAIVDCEEADPRFHARHHATSRAYFYQISTRKTALSKKFVWWIKEPLDLTRMQQAAASIVGRHDFTAFRSLDKSKPDESTIVVVESAEVAVDDNLVVFRIEASHFLWKMVRRLTGCLVKVGLGEMTVDEFGALITRKPGAKAEIKLRSGVKLDIAAWTAPASGLFLESVRY